MDGELEESGIIVGERGLASLSILKDACSPFPHNPKETKSMSDLAWQIPVILVTWSFAVPLIWIGVFFLYAVTRTNTKPKPLWKDDDDLL